MAETLTTVREETLASEVNSTLYQKFPLNSKKQKRKGFSVAEAMIALLIGSLALGMAAPMITKQIKQSNLTEVQFRMLRQSMVPRGAIMYFDLDNCPEGWSELTRFYPDSANSFIRNKSGTTRARGHWQENAAPEIEGDFNGNVNDTIDNKYKGSSNNKGFSGSFYYTGERVVGSDGQGDSLGGFIGFKASLSSDAYGRKDEKGVVATEVRPDNIAFLACRKD